MKHTAIQEAQEKIVAEVTELLKTNNNVIEFSGHIITVEDPDIDTDYGDNAIGIEKLVYDSDEETVYAHGAPYEGDCGARGENAEPIDIEVLNVEEIAALLDAAKSTVEG